MNCSHCGAPLTSGAMKCGNCGVSFSQPVPQFVQRPSTAGKSKIPVWVWVLGGCGCSVIPVIAILAAILFPVFAKAREEARQMTCQTNEKQIGIGLQQYIQDYDNRLPPANPWEDATYPYIKSNLSCPDAGLNQAYGYGYAYNSRLNKKKTADFSEPAFLTALYDSTSLTPDAADPIISAPVPGRHSKGNNYLFLDGHVDWLNSPPTN